MTTNDLIAAVQETLAKYQQNGVKEEDSAQWLETQLTDLKANVTQLQDSLQSAQEEKRLLLETLREQSQQLLTLTQHVTTTTLGVAPQVEAKAAPPSAPAQHSDVEAKVDEPTVAKSAKTVSTKGKKAAPAKAPAKSKSTATKKGAKVTQAEAAPPESKPPSDTPSLDQLWDHVRAFNAGKPFGQRIRFDENLAMNHFGFKPSEWKDWFKGTNSAKVKRQPPQVRTNQRKAAKEGIDTLKQQWTAKFPSFPAMEDASTSETSPPDVGVTPSETSSSKRQEDSAVASTVVAEPESTTDPALPPTKTTSAKKASKASATKKAGKAASTKKAAKKSAKPTPPETSNKTTASDGSQPKAMQELFEFFQSWNQQEGNAAVRFTTHTSAAFDNIEIEQAREWIDQHPDEVKQLNEGIPPNNRRDARQALAQLKATWSVL
ncbi:MAG: hypothetical protein AAFY26_14620 [Cyanobacteria bacterium J06638_22]